MERKRISLSLKQLLPHPWEKIEDKLKIGDKAATALFHLQITAFIEIEKVLKD